MKTSEGVYGALDSALCMPEGLAIIERPAKTAIINLTSGTGESFTFSPELWLDRYSVTKLEHVLKSRAEIDAQRSILEDAVSKESSLIYYKVKQFAPKAEQADHQYRAKMYGYRSKCASITSRQLLHLPIRWTPSNNAR